MKKKILPIVSFILLVLVVSLILVQQTKKPDPAVVAVTELYFESVKQLDYETLDEILYFGSEHENWRAPIYRSMKDDYLISYKIQRYKKLGDDIYQVTILHDTKQKSDRQAENYVIRIEGEWLYAANPRNVPSEIYIFDEYDDTMLLID